MLGKLKLFFIDLRLNAPILRCVFGVTLALIVSTSLGYLVPHITAIFALMFLQPNQKPLGLKKEVGILFVLSLLGYFGVLLGDYLIDFPLVIMPLLGLIIYWSYRLVKIPEPVRLLFLILAVLIPFISIKANLLGSIVLSALMLNLIVALIVIRISYFIFPLNSRENIEIDKEEKANPFQDVNLDKLAFNGLLVVFPVVLFFFLYNVNIALLTLVFVVLLSFDPFIYNSKKGTALFAANVIGGLVGILVYNVLVMAPSYVLYIFLILSVAFYFVMHIYSGKKTAPIFRISFNTFFVTMGIISTSSTEASSAVWERLLQIGLAIIYVIVAFRLVNTLNNPKLLND